MINHYHMAKHFTLEIADESFTFTRNTEAIAAEAALDGIYVLRTSLPTDTLTQSEVVARYKNLADVERFRELRCDNYSGRQRAASLSQFVAGDFFGGSKLSSSDDIRRELRCRGPVLAPWPAARRERSRRETADPTFRGR